MPDTLDDVAVHRWCRCGLAALRAHQHEIDELNVYPVPDGDTGTNLVLTLTAAQEALDDLLIEESGAARAAPVVTAAARQAASAAARSGSGRVAPTGVPAEVAAPGGPGSTPVGRAMRRMARGALLGARGNSGMIVSQILRGMADSVGTPVVVGGAELARAFRRATEAAYGAVARPVEGTVLSVLAAAAQAADRVGSDDPAAVARAAARAAGEALARTPQQLPALARAGVVDAGGRGLCLLLDALVEALRPVAADTVATVDAGPAAPVTPPARTYLFGYEVQYLLAADAGAADALRRSLDALGDSLVIVGTGDGDPPTWNVHVHVAAADIGPALEAGVEAGRPYRITVTPLDDPAGHAVPVATAAEPPAASSARRPDGVNGDADDPDSDARQDEQPGARDEHLRSGARGAVVGAAGDGLTALFEAEGTVVVGHNPSTREILDAITATGCRGVVLLPNDANSHAVAAAAAREADRVGIRVSVVPTRSPVQALAALAVRDPTRPFTDDVIAMAEAAGACRYGEVCTAQRAALTVAGPCRAGDLLGLVDGEVHVIGTDVAEVSRRLLDRMLGGGGELATLVLGADAPVALEQTLTGHLAQTWPFVEVQCYAGGQPRYHLLVGVE